jgi:hypothetical protein
MLKILKLVRDIIRLFLFYGAGAIILWYLNAVVVPRIDNIQRGLDKIIPAFEETK